MKYINSRNAMFAAIAMLAVTLSGCASYAAPKAVEAATPRVAIPDGDFRTGMFSGLSDHITTGDVTIVEGPDGVQIVLGENFSLDGAPDPKVGLGKDGEYDPATAIHALGSNTGLQTYALPTSINVDDYNEVYIWCGEFAVGLGVASLSSK